MHIEPALEGVPINFEQILEKAGFHDNVPLKTTYTGIRGVDAALSGLVVAFTSGTAGWEAEVRLQQINFLFNFSSIVCIWNVEACRPVTAPFAFFYQTIGGAVIIPLYYLTYQYSYMTDGRHSSGREVSLSYARALVPATLLGYLIPTIAMYSP
ncbi:hypothetical protein EJ08DRAFT_709293 [Tothia fuscella]|uniref:Uncharacterized protein n=1 Tax=Tothia fuscella TaxID=1048955 RepID=A0A9P4NDV4_9PEZI|nr:hypothetical protein EJ08DRAFT_709293 [Tothia fuscella]